jgi:hypothetical protein
MATLQATSVLSHISIPAQIHAGFFSPQVIIAIVLLVAIVWVYKALVWD